MAIEICGRDRGARGSVDIQVRRLCRCRRDGEHLQFSRISAFSTQRDSVRALYTPALVILIPNDVLDASFRVEPEVVTKSFTDLGLRITFYDT